MIANYVCAGLIGVGCLLVIAGAVCPLALALRTTGNSAIAWACLGGSVAAIAGYAVPRAVDVAWDIAKH